MKKEYEAPKAERMDFDYTDAVVASACKGGIYQMYTDKFTGCRQKETDVWVGGYGTNEH